MRRSRSRSRSPCYGLEKYGMLRNSLTWEEKCKTELETTNTLSSCGPKRGKRMKIEDSPDSSRHRLHGKQDYNGTTSRRFSQNGSKGGDLTTTKNATNCGKLSNSGRIVSTSSSWNHSKWGDRTAAMITPNSSMCRPEDDKQDPDVKVDKWNGPSWGDRARIKETPNSCQWRTDADVSSGRTNHTSPQDGWGDQTTKGTVWKGPKWGDQTTKQTSWDGPKWGDQTTKETSWDGPKRSDHQTEYAAAHKPPQETSDDKLGENVKTGYSLSLDGSKWGEQKRKSMKDASRSFQCIPCDGKQDSDVETRNGVLWDGPTWEEQSKTELETQTPNSLSTNDQKWSKQRTLEDSFNPSQQRLDDYRPDYNGKTSRSFSRNSSEGGQITTKNATNSDNWGNCGRIARTSSWNHPKCCERTTSRATPNSSTCRSDDDKQGSDVKADKSNGPKWCDKITKKTTWKGPTWGDETSRETSWDGPKWGDQTTKETSWDAPKWSDHQIEYAAAHKLPQETSDDKLGENVKTGYSLSLDGSKWGEQKRKVMKDASRPFQCIPYDGKHDSNVETSNGVLWDGPTWEEQSKTELETQTPNSLSTNDQKWSKQRTLEDSFNPSQQRLDDYRPDYNGKTSRSFSRNGSEGGQITTKNATNSDNWGNCGRIASTSSWNHPKCCERTTSRATPNSSTCRSDDDKQGSDVKADKLNGPKWCDKRTKKTTWKGPTWGDEASRETSWDGPKWGDQTTKETSWDAPKWGDQTTKEASWKHQKWGDQTSKETPCDGPKWGDHHSTKDADAQKPSQESSNNGKGNNNVKTEINLSQDGVLWDGPTWEEQSKTELETQTPNSLTNDLKWSKQRTLEDSFNPSQQRLDDNRPDYNGKTSRSFSWNGWKGERITTKNATNSDNWGNCGRIASTSSWNHPKCCERTTSRATPNSSTCRSDDDKHGSDVKADKSNGPMWCDKRTKKTTWKGPTWDDETSRETSWDGPKWGDHTTKETSWKHQKWSDQTSKETSGDGPKWGDHQSTKEADVHKPSQESSNNGKSNNNVKTEINLSQDGPNCCKQKNIQHSSISSLDRADFDRPYHNVKADNNLSLDVSREGDKTSVQDAPYSSQQLLDADNWGNVENDYFTSQFVQKCGEETLSEDAFISCQRRSDNDVHGSNIATDKSLVQTDPKWDHQMTCKDASNSSMWKSKNAGSGVSAAWSTAIEVTGDDPLQPSPHEAFRRALSSQEQDFTQVDSGKGQHALTILQPPSTIYTFDFNISGEEILDQQNINLREKGEQTLFPPRNGQDAIPRPPNQESFNSDLQDHQVLVNHKKTLKPLIDEPYVSTAATPVQTNLVSQATKRITTDSADLPRGHLSVSFQTKEQTMAYESLTTAKNSASSFFSAQPDNGNRTRKADKEPKHEELSANEANAGKETETLQNTNTMRTCQPEDVDAYLKAERDSGKTKDDQWIRMFKFALVEFVKDILKPSWKEGHLSKENHKTIVKKVVDKVIDTLRGPNIPRSQEQIDLYLSFSKTKLSNLVLEYLGRYLES